MAKSGKCTITRNSYSIPNNTSTITVTGVITTTGESYRGDERKGTYTIKQGSTVIKSGSFTHGAPTNSTTTLFSVQLTVSHKSDGTSDTITASYNYDSGWCTGTGTLALGTIPRQATLTAAPNFNDEGNPQITYSNPAGNSVSTLQACIASDDGKTIYAAYRDISKTGTTYTFNLTDAERTALRKACSASKSMDVRFYVKTVLASTNYYSSAKKTLTIVNAAPTLSATAEDVNAETVALTGNKNTLVKYKSNVQVSMTAEALKEATIKSYAIACGDKSIAASSGTLTAVENATITCKVTDSRGNTATETLIKTMIPYIPLSCVFTPSQPSAEGDMSFTVSGTCYSGSFGSKSNAITVQYRYKADDGGYGDWTTISNVTFADGKYVAKGSVTGLDYTKTYKFQARIVDSLDIKETSEYGISINPIFYWGKDRFNFGVNVMVGNKTGYKDGKTGIYADKKGFLILQRDSSDGKPYIGFYVDDETEESGRIALDSGIMKFLSAANGYKFDNDVILPNGVAMYGMDSSGGKKALAHIGGSNNAVFGSYSLGSNIYGNDVAIYSASAGNVGARPYWRKGDSFSYNIKTAGFVTNGGTEVYFALPLNRILLGSGLTVTATTGSGFVLRQDGKYTHGSSASEYAKPTKYTVYAYSNYLACVATFSATTNVVNNAPIGVHWDGSITIS